MSQIQRGQSGGGVGAVSGGVRGGGSDRGFSMKLMDLDVSDILGIKHGAQKHYRDVVGASQIMGAMNNSARRVLDNWR